MCLISFSSSFTALSTTSFLLTFLVVQVTILKELKELESCSLLGFYSNWDWYSN